MASKWAGSPCPSPAFSPELCAICMQHWLSRPNAPFLAKNFFVARINFVEMCKSCGRQSVFWKFVSARISAVRASTIRWVCRLTCPWPRSPFGSSSCGQNITNFARLVLWRWRFCGSSFSVASCTVLFYFSNCWTFSRVSLAMCSLRARQKDTGFELQYFTVILAGPSLSNPKKELLALYGQHGFRSSLNKDWN